MLLCQTLCHRLYSHVSQFIVQSTSLTAVCNAMSHCHCLYSHVSQYIVQSTSLTAICNAMLRRFVNVSRRFERSQSHHILGQSGKEGCTLQGLKSVGSPLSEPQTSLSLPLSPPPSLSLSLSTIQPAASSLLFGASPYRMLRQKLYCPQ